MASTTEQAIARVEAYLGVRTRPRPHESQRNTATENVLLQGILSPGVSAVELTASDLRLLIAAARKCDTCDRAGTSAKVTFPDGKVFHVCDDCASIAFPTLVDRAATGL